MPVSVICSISNFFQDSYREVCGYKFVVNALQGRAKPLGAMHAARKGVWGEKSLEDESTLQCAVVSTRLYIWSRSEDSSSSHLNAGCQ